MTRACGIRIGPRRYEIVILDGGAKSHQITAYRAGDLPHVPADEFVSAAAKTLKAIASEYSIPRENVGVAIDSGHAAFRRSEVPFSDRAKIEQVLKYEIEGELPQWSIDDVIVDFHTLAADDSKSVLLITAVPKDDIEDVLSICEKANIEPLEIELEASSIVNAAMAADICHIDDSQLLVHVGEHSTAVVVMDAGEIREMRVIHIGALTHEAPPLVEEAEVQSEESGGESDQNGNGEDEADSGEVAPVLSEEESAELDELDRSRRIDQAIKRIRRELGRTISAARTTNAIEAVYVCGMELPGLIGSEVLDVPVYVLDCFEEDGGQPADGFGALVVAYGVAVRRLGGGVTFPSLRREELKYTGAFERIEFPLAIACLLLWAFLGVINILQFREQDWLERYGHGTWLLSSNAFMVGDPKNNMAGNLVPVPEDIKLWADEVNSVYVDGESTDATPLDALQEIKSNLQGKIIALQRDLGQDKDVVQPQSAFVAAILTLNVLEDHQEEWQPSLRRVRAVYQPGRGGSPDTVKVTLEVTFFAENTIIASQNYEAFEQALRTQPWFVSFDRKTTEPLEDGRGIWLSGIPITVDVSKYYASIRPAQTP